MYSAGIDIGSISTKAVIMKGGEILAGRVIFTGYNAESAGRKAFDAVLADLRLDRSAIARIVSTGYGRKSLALADKSVTEIMCHAAGARHISPRIRSIIDIGGQDSKAILLDDRGKVANFAMNDKCAAGTGRFLQMMAHVLDYDIGDFGSVDPWGEFQPISSMCAVFAETEVVGHLARGVDRESLVRGLLRSIASRSAAMLARIGMKEPLFFSGGVSRSPSLVRLIGRETDCEILTSDRSQFAGAIGAALIGWEDEERDGNHT